MGIYVVDVFAIPHFPLKHHVRIDVLGLFAEADSLEEVRNGLALVPRRALRMF